MDVTIQQAVSSPPSQYEIETPGCIYQATRKWLSWHGEAKLFGPRDCLVATIGGKPGLLTVKFQFLFDDGRNYDFWLEDRWKGIDLCEGKGEAYKLLRHKGLDYSVFQDINQIA